VAGSPDSTTPGALRVAAAILALPFVATLVVPGLIVAVGESSVGCGLEGAAVALPVAAGALLLGAGVALFVTTVHLFTSVGQGTLAPWDPPRRLVVRGPYRHLRHPMISGIILVLAGESLIVGSAGIAIWLLGFVAVNAVYLPLVEEPALVRRFGADYRLYMANVGRWVPRLRPWRSPADVEGAPSPEPLP
jgi:protein-S-isoprenylcysteine O-methyltransferase Ste14